MKSNVSFLSFMFLLFLFGKLACLGLFITASWWEIFAPLIFDFILHVLKAYDTRYQCINRLILWLKQKQLERAKKHFKQSTSK